jgi:hypothetical protein
VQAGLQIARSTPTTAMMSVTADSHWNPFRRHTVGTVVEESTTPARTPLVSKSKTWETAVDRVPSWPEEARPLKHHDWIAYLFIIGDIILVLLPIYFICKFGPVLVMGVN